MERLRLQVGLRVSLASEDNARVLDFSPLPSRTSNFPERGPNSTSPTLSASASLTRRPARAITLINATLAPIAPMRAVHGVDEPAQIARVQRLHRPLHLFHALDRECCRMQ